MRSAFAVFLRGFTLPFGVSSGRRIVFDGDNGRIYFYNSAGDLVGRLEPTVTDNMIIGVQRANGARAELQSSGGAASLVLDPADEAGYVIVRGYITGDFDPSPGVERPWINIVSPTVDGGDSARVFIVGEDAAGNRPFVSIDGGDGLLADFILNRKSMPRGVPIGGRFRTTASDDAARAANVNTDMTVTFDASSVRNYQVSLNAQVTLGTAGAPYFVDLHDGTSFVGRFASIPAALCPAGSVIHYINAVVDYVPGTTGSKTLTVRNGAGSGGTIALQRGLADITFRSLTVTDVGRISLAI